MPGTPLINGNEYAWADIKVNFLGRTVEGIKAIDYTAAQEKQNVYAAGKEPNSRTRGKKTYEASITLLRKEVNAILNALPPGQDLTDIKPFEIIVAYENGDGIIVYDKIQATEFMEDSRSASEGDLELPVELPLLPGKIIYNYK